jgi:hypothetical protein
MPIHPRGFAPGHVDVSSRSHFELPMIGVMMGLIMRAKIMGLETTAYATWKNAAMIILKAVRISIEVSRAMARMMELLTVMARKILRLVKEWRL